MVRNRGRYIFTVFIVILVVVLLVGCTGTPKLSSVPPSSSDGVESESGTPPVDTEEQPVTPIKPNLPPVEAIDPERINLPYDEIGVSPKYCEIEIQYVDGDMLYASILDMRENGNLLETEGIVAYNIASEETEIYDYSEGDRIISFAVQMETIYYVSIGYVEDNLRWSLIKSDLGFSSKTVIVSGDGINPMMAPELVLKDGKMYLASLDETREKGTFAISEVTGDTLRQILSVDTSEEFPRNFTKVRVNGGFAYYMSSDKADQYVKKLNLTTGERETLYTLPNSSGMLFGFVQTEKMLFVSHRDKSGGMIVSIKVPGREESYKFESILSRESALQNGDVVVNDYGTLTVFGEAGDVERQLEISDLDVLPYFEVYDEDTLIVQDSRSGELYFCDIV